MIYEKNHVCLHQNNTRKGKFWSTAILQGVSESHQSFVTLWNWAAYGMAFKLYRQPARIKAMSDLRQQIKLEGA